MSVRVTVERTVIPGAQREIAALLRTLLSKAIQFPGYQSGETMVGVFNPMTFLTIVRFTTLTTWQEWERNPERLKIVGEINTYLQGDPIIRLWNEDPDAPLAGA